MKRKLIIALMILTSILLLISCQPAPEGEGPRNMTESDYKVNKNALDRTEAAQAYIGSIGIAPKGISLDAAASTISYTVDKPMKIALSELRDESPSLFMLLPQVDDFYVISGSITMSFKGLEGLANARDIDDIFPILSMNLVMADDIEGTKNRTVVAVSYDNGVGTISINNTSYALASLEMMDEYGEIIEDILEAISEEDCIYLDGELIDSNSIITAFMEENAVFELAYEDIEKDEEFSFEGEFSISRTTEGESTSIALSITGKVTDKENDDPFIVENADFSIKLTLSVKEGVLDIAINELKIANVELWDGMLDLEYFV